MVIILTPSDADEAEPHVAGALIAVFRSQLTYHQCEEESTHGEEF